jgi:DNA-directed RNA polymerase specialized sigma24 family protein
MLDHGRVAIQPDQKREQLFTDRYEGLLACALRLTNQLRDAEDLVHDAFVQWVLGRTRLEEIENIDGYLRRMLRYMHISRISRSAQQLHETVLSVADYDSFRLGWTAIEPPRRMQASQELHQICAYACSRKESSRAGSVLILRFFHDYFPIEIAGILNSSRQCVDQWQRLARREVKLFLNKPGRLGFVSAKAATERHPVRYLRSECDLMLDLRRMIFNSCQGDCLSQFELKEVYSEGHAEALTTRKLAHIVSCAPCLDAVNGLLGLPLLAQRYHAAPYERKEPPHDKTGGGISGGASADLTKRLAYKLREIHEHKPHELRIAVNGFLVSSLKVNPESSELNLNLTPDEPAEFVEICSEQGVQLLFFSVNPSGSKCEQWACIELSEGRSLEACFRNENGPSLHMIYKDPVPAEAHISGETPNQKFLSSPLSIESFTRKIEHRGFHLGSWARWVCEILKIVARQPVVAEGHRSREVGLARSLDGKVREAPFLMVLGQSQYGHRKHTWLGLVIGLIAAAVVAGFLFFKVSLEPAMTATVLLEKAKIAERIRDEIPDRVRHRLIDLEERHGGVIVAQRKIEVWENRANGDRSQRLYDDSNRMIAGVWQTASGSRTVYHHGSKPQSQPLPTTPDDLLLNLDDIWQLQPSAQAFGSLITEPAVTNVEERSTIYVLRNEKERTIGASRLLKATLTLSKSDLHSIEQTLLIQRGSELREYRFVEASWELVPVNAVAPTAFEIEPELTGGTRETGRPGDGGLRELTSSRVPSSLSTSAPPVASAELEVDVAYLLNQAKADRNEQVALTRSAGGSLRVEGVVDTAERKNEFLRALGPVSNNPAVKIEIRTIEEAKQRPVSAGSVSVQEVTAPSNKVAVDDELRAYFSKNNPGGSTDEAIRSYSSQMVNRAYRALFHAIELKRLVNRFTNVDMRRVAPDARAKWLAMLREHVTAFAHENAVLRQEIGPVFFPGPPLNVTEEDLIKSDADLARAVEQLHKLALADNDAIRSAFTISSQSSAARIKSAAFWQSIQRAENLAERIKQYQTTSN